MKISLHSACLHLEAETSHDAYLVGQIFQAVKTAGLDCTSSGDGLNLVDYDYVVIALEPRTEEEEDESGKKVKK